MERYQSQMIKHLCEWIEIPSVYSDQDPGYLFGEAIDRCLDLALQLMESLGFRTVKAVDGAYGYAEIGEGQLFGILGHLDVVPADESDGWVTEPFKGVLKEDRINGRGAQDDKGPLIAAIFAVKAMIDQGHVFKKRVRFIFGTDEESLWRCIKSYTEREEIPVMGFTPDSTFPVTYAEKGLLQLELKYNHPNAFQWQGGDAINSAAAWASCHYNLAIEDALVQLGYEYKIANEMLVVIGKTAHAKNPWKGISGIERLAEAAAVAGIEEGTIDFVNCFLSGKYWMEGFTVDEPMASLCKDVTLNLGKLRSDKDTISLYLDLRLPIKCHVEHVKALIERQCMAYGFEMMEWDWLNPIEVPIESDLVSTLLSAYQEVTGDTQSIPILSAGASYARAFPNHVAFGANMPGYKTTEHQPNEHFKIQHLMDAAKIYKVALEKLV